MLLIQNGSQITKTHKEEGVKDLNVEIGAAGGQSTGERMEIER